MAMPPSCWVSPRARRCLDCGKQVHMHSDRVHARPYHPNDLDDLYSICVLTADNGQDGTPLFRDPRLPGHVYMAPYVTFEPSLAFVAEDASGVGGYVVAALDSRAFEHRLKDDWWPKLRVSYPEPPPDVAEALPAPERYALQDIHHHWGTADQPFPFAPAHRLAAATAGTRDRPAANRNPGRQASRSRHARAASDRRGRQPESGRVLPAPRFRRAPSRRHLPRHWVAHLHHGSYVSPGAPP
jgi:hypothetical protein